MTLRHFKIFAAVCDTMNMTAAAEKLYMSQSAVSQAIAELERYYDVRLFERLSRKLYLTQAGKRLLSYARPIIRMNAEAKTSMQTLLENSSIRLGASVTVSAYVLPKQVAAFGKISLQTDITVIEDNTQKIENLILQDEIDIGLVEGDISSPDIVIRPFLEDELMLICAANHRFAQYTEIEPKELEHEKFIIREKGSGTRKTFEDMMTVNGLAWRESWTCNNADTIKIAVAEGLGVSVISRRAVANEIAAGVLCEKQVRGIRFNRQFKIVYHKNKYLTEPMEQFIQLCVATEA